MSTWHEDGRVTRRQLVATCVRGDEGTTLGAPAVGLWRRGPAPGARVQGGMSIGELEVLGVLHELVAPDDCEGVVMPAAGAHLGERAVAYGDVLLELGALELGAAADGARGGERAAETGALVFRAPLSGRFYARSGPDKPAFVSVGDVIEHGHTVALLEVMKTFNRLTYGGPGMPGRAKVVAVLVKDEDDVEAGAAILELAPA
jgi:acetyl-CoA carboxylase biotin carboxyl carrier protein